MINLFDCVYGKQGDFNSRLKLGEDLEMTKADNAPTLLTKLGVRKPVYPDSRLKNIRQFINYEHFQYKLLYKLFLV